MPKEKNPPEKEDWESVLREKEREQGRGANRNGFVQIKRPVAEEAKVRIGKWGKTKTESDYYWKQEDAVLKNLAANRAVLVQASVGVMMKGCSRKEKGQKKQEKKDRFLSHYFFPLRLAFWVAPFFLFLCLAQTRRISWQSRHSSKTWLAANSCQCRI